MNKLMVLVVFFPVFAQAETIGTVETSGMLFKDSLTIEAFDDPDIKGVACYTTVHARGLAWNEGSASVSLACRKVGTISGDFSNRANVFSRNKNIFFKKTVVDRFYDAKRRVLVYLTYTKDTGNENKDHSLSVVPID